MIKYFATTALVIGMAAPAFAGDRDQRFISPSANALAAAGAAAKASAGAHSSSKSTARQYNSQQAINKTSYVNREAASSAIAPNVTAIGDCKVGAGVGASDVIQSVSIGLTWNNIPCVVRQEAAELHQMVGREAAILHLHRYHKRMRHTLEAAGVVKARQ